MTNETYQKKLNTILSEEIENPEFVYSMSEEILNLTNILKSDIAQAIKDNSQDGDKVSFIDVPKAIEIVTNGGVPTKRELIELAQEYMNEGNVAKANELLDRVLKNE